MARLSYYFIFSLLLISLGTKVTFADDDDDKDDKEDLCKNLGNSSQTIGGKLDPTSNVNTYGNNVTSGQVIASGGKRSFIDVQHDLPLGTLVKFFLFADGSQQGNIRLQIWREVNDSTTYVLSWEHKLTLSQSSGALYTVVIPKDKWFDVKEKDVMGFTTEGDGVPITYRSVAGHKTRVSKLESNPFPNLEDTSKFDEQTGIQFSIAVEILDCEQTVGGASLMFVSNFLLFCCFLLFRM